jgi:FMN phosphatase YigB (HAD superfamily)
VLTWLEICVWPYPEVAPELRALHANGFKIVIFSNQNGVKAGAVTRPILSSSWDIFITSAPQATQRIPQQALMMS